MKTKLYMMPGLMCNEQLWSAFPKNDDFELIHISIPKENSIEQIIQVLDKTLPKEKINLVGFSLGGYIASVFALTYPERINKLFVISATGCALPQEEIQKREQLLQLNKSFILQNLSRQKVLTLLDKKHHNNEAMISLIQEMYQSLGENVFVQQMGATIHRQDLLEAFKKVSFQTFFLYAKKDRLVNTTWLEHLETQTNIRQHSLNSHSHMLPLEEPKIVMKHLNNFFK